MICPFTAKIFLQTPKSSLKNHCLDRTGDLIICAQISLCSRNIQCVSHHCQKEIFLLMFFFYALDSVYFELKYVFVSLKKKKLLVSGIQHTSLKDRFTDCESSTDTSVIPCNLIRNTHNHHLNLITVSSHQNLPKGFA